MNSTSPLLTVWLHPRATVRDIIARDPNHGVLPIICLVGIVNALDRASIRSLGDQVSWPIILVVAVLLGPIGGLITLWIGSHLIRWTGTWLGGTAPRKRIETAIAWASVPVAATLLLWIPELVIFREEMFTSGTPRMDENMPLIFLLLAFSWLEIVLGVWSLVLACNTIAEVQSYRSAWRGFGNILLAGLVIAVPILLIVVAVLAISR